MIDLDASLYVEYDDGTKEPLALIETAMDRGQSIKPATVTKSLASRCYPLLPAFVLLYKLSDWPNPADGKCRDIVGFRVKKIWPEPERGWKEFSPEEWAKMLVKLREWSARHVDRMFDPPETDEGRAA